MVDLKPPNFRVDAATKEIFISQTTDSHFANYRFSFRKLLILISQTTDFHFANYRFSFRKLQISISFRSISFRKTTVSQVQVQRIPRETYSIQTFPTDSPRDSSRVPPQLACVPGARKGKEERKIGCACFDVCALNKRSTYCRICRDETFCFRSIPFKPMNQTYLRRSLGIDIIYLLFFLHYFSGVVSFE